MAKPTFDSIKPEYAALWTSMVIRPEHQSDVNAFAQQIMEGRARYETVSRQTGVPWYVIGLLHNMECSLSFHKHLHNGDPLNEVTHNDPKGRGPFATWEESAVDALKFDGLDKVDWSKDVVERIAYMAETFNGFGYRKSSINIHSPYLWSFTTAYSKGKFVKDGVYSSEFVSKQCGVMALLRAMIDLMPDAIHVAPVSDAHPWPSAEVPASPPPSVTKEGAKSKSVWTLFAVIFGWIEEQFHFVQDMLPDAQKTVSDVVDPLTALGGMLKINLASIVFVLSLAGVLVVIYRHSRDKAALAAAKGDSDDQG